MGKLSSFRGWFEKRLDDAIQAAEAERQAKGNGNGNNQTGEVSVTAVSGGGGGGDNNNSQASNSGSILKSESRQTGGGGGSSRGGGRSNAKANSSGVVFNEEPLRALPDPPFPFSAYSQPPRSEAGPLLSMRPNLTFSAQTF